MYTVFFILAALLYATCAFLPAGKTTAISIGTLVAWCLHGGALLTYVSDSQSLRVGFAMMLSATMWISAGAYWLENRNFSLDGMRVLVLPIAAVAVLLPLIFPGNVMPLAGRSLWFPWHVFIAILSYSTLTIAAFHGVLMALQESRLHAKLGNRSMLGTAIDRLPPLLAMERMLFRLIAFGFGLLTLTVLSGILFSERVFGTAFQWDHKNVFTLLSWILFGMLLVGRQWRGWRGKTALRFTLAGFATLLLAYVGTRFVFEVFLQRGIV